MNGKEIAEALFDALERNDTTGFLGLCAEDAVVWHNFDGIDTPIAHSATVLSAVHRVVNHVRYADRRYVALDDGAMVQHVLRGVSRSGQPIDIPIMLRLCIADGRVQRIEEYCDTAQTAALVQELRGAGMT